VDLGFDESFGDLREAFVLPIGGAPLDDKVLALDVAELTHAQGKGRKGFLRWHCSAAGDEPYAPQPFGLRAREACAKNRHRCGASKNPNKVTPSHPITSSDHLVADPASGSRPEAGG